MSEIIVVIVVIGLLSMIAVPVYSGIRKSALENAAMHNARLVNAARDSYALTIPSAAPTWISAQDDEARLRLLITENLLPGQPSDYLSMSGNYSLQLPGGVRTRTILVLNGTPLGY